MCFNSVMDELWLNSLLQFSMLILSKCYFKVIFVVTVMYMISLLPFFWCYIIQCLRHVTISLLLWSMLKVLCVCMDVPVCLHFRYMYSLYYKIYDDFCASRSNFIAFQGPIILICWNVNFLHVPSSNSRLKLALPWHCLGFFCSGCRQHCNGVAMIQYLYSITKILREHCLVGSSVACVCV